MKTKTMLFTILVVSALCVGALAETQTTSGARPLVLGHGVGLFKVGRLLVRDDFKDLKNWVVQIQPRSGFAPAKVRVRDNTLDCLVPGRGCTIWFKRKLKTRVTITYDVLCPTPKPAIEGVQPRDINNFWLATDPVDPKEGLFDATRYTGKFGSYDKMHGYYASTGGGGAVANLTTRMRRYPREVDGRPAEHLALNDKDGQREYLITPDKVMSVQLVAYDDVVQYIVDGRLNYQIASGDRIYVEGRDSDGERVMKKAIYDLKRFPVYREGYFGFRMVGTHHIYTNFRVYALEPDDGTERAPSQEKAVSTWSYTKETPQQHADKMQWWKMARFGMFVHWGVYAVTGGEYRGHMPSNSAEWMMNKARIPIAEYKTENVDKFNPTEFDAKTFVGLAKEAGMKYLVITAKHHDGFSMFHSKCSPYNVVDATPFKRDVMMELAQACREEGIRFGFYYSQCQDWHHPGGMGNNWDKTIKRVSFDEYVREKAVPEARQLLTEYGTIAIFWWDTPREMSKEAFNSLHSVTDLQPGIITNDRLGKEYRGDYKTFERRIPRHAPSDEYWEVCMPISGSWGYKKSDTKFKSKETLIRNLVDIASKGGNYLLNVSPTGKGSLLPQATERLKAIGRWMKINGESIYGTTASPFGRLEWGRCTKKEFARGTILYLHVFDWPEDGKLRVPGLKNKVEQAYLMADWKALEAHQEDSGIAISLPGQAPDPIASVVVVKVSGALEIASTLPVPSKDGSLVLSADMAHLHNNEGTRDVRVQSHDGIAHLGYWTDADAWVEWSLELDRPGRYEISAALAVEQEKSRFHLEISGQKEQVEVYSTGGYRDFVKKSLCTINIDKPGKQTLRMKPDSDSWQPINLRQLTLKLSSAE